MKLRSIVLATVGALALASTSSALAAAPAAQTKSNPRGDMTSLQNRANRIESVLNQNEGSVLAEKPYLGSDWAKRITVSGQLNVDGKWSNHRTGPQQFTTPGNSLFRGSHQSDIFLNNSQIDVDAYINSWAKAHISLTGSDPARVSDQAKNDFGNTGIELDEAYITFGDLDKYPVYATVGRQYIPFGVYTRHVITDTLTQSLSETQETAAKLGFATAFGLYGSAYDFRGQTDGVNGAGTANNNTNYRSNNFGAELGITNPNQNLPEQLGGYQMGYMFSVGYLNDMQDVDAIANVLSAAPGGGAQYRARNTDVHGVAVDGSVNSGPFSLAGHYVQALNDFDGATPNGLANSRPWAAMGVAAYDFKVMDHDTTLAVNYQQSGQTRNLGLPKRRFGANYKVGVLKDTNVEFQLLEDQNFDSAPGAEWRTEGAVRLSVDF